MDYLNNLLIIISCLLAIPTLVFVVQVFSAENAAGLSDELSAIRPLLAVLVPAHNEELVIAKTLHAIVSQLGDGDRLIVVADNCTDQTVAIANQCGAIVLERQDKQQRGKGYALNYGLNFLADNQPPEVVIIIDADCQLSPSCIDILARRTGNENRPVQVLDLMKAPEKKSIALEIAEFAWLVKNQVRPLGLRRFGLPCQLMGTGMAFPWALLRQANLAHGNMVEDMKLGIDLALLGFTPSFCPSACVTSEFPVSSEVAANQRKRWEHGHLFTIFAETPRLLKAALQRREFSLLAMALDLSVPPLSALGLCLLGMLGISILLAFTTGQLMPFWMMVSLCCVFAAAVFSAWYRFGQACLSFKSLCGTPYYVWRKIPIYLTFLVKRQQGWLKTERR